MNKKYICKNCNNVYAHRQSLWRHKQNCNTESMRQDAASSSIDDHQNSDEDDTLSKKRKGVTHDDDPEDGDNNQCTKKNGVRKKCMVYHTSDGECLRATPERNGDGIFLRPHGKISSIQYNYMARNGEGMYIKTTSGNGGGGLKKISSKMEFKVY